MSLEKGRSVWFLKVVEVNWKLRPVNWKGQLPGWKLLKWKRNLRVIHNGYPNRSWETKPLHNTMAPWGPPTESTRLPTTSFSCNQNIAWPQVNEKEPNAVGIDLSILTVVDKYRIDGCFFVFGFGFLCPITEFCRSKGYILANQRSNIKFVIANDFLSANPNWKLLGLLLILQNVHGRMFLASPQCETSLPQLFQVQYLVFLRLHTTFGCWSTCDF